MSTSDRQAQQRLAELLDRADLMQRRLSFDDLRELAHVYRLSSARLAVLRSRGNDPEAMRYLNALCVRAFTYLQVAPPPDRRVRRFFMAEFPATLAATARLQALTAVLMMAAALIGATMVSENPAALSICIPSAMYPPNDLERLLSSSAERARFLAHMPFGFGLKSLFSAGLFVHNLQVGLLAFATGILAGLPTLILVFYNGLTVGAFAWIFSRDAAWPIFWAWLLPHAIPELLAVTLCASGGLLIAKAVVAPGRHGIAAALREAARPALQMVVAALPLFIVAAIMESFLRQSDLSTAVRFAFAAAALAAILSYIGYVRRLMRRAPASDLSWLVTARPPGELQDSGSKPAQ